MSRKKTLISDLNLARIGDRIAFLRVRNNLTQAQFAEKTGLSKGNISGLESNHYEPSARAIIKIVELFNVSSDWILFGEKTAKEENNDTSKLPTKHQNLSGKIPHEELIKYFEQQDLAWEINWDLLKLEKIDKSELKEVKKYIKFRIFEKEQLTSENSSAQDSKSDSTRDKKIS